MVTMPQCVEKAFKSGKNKDLADPPPALFCIPFLPLALRLIFLPGFALMPVPPHHASILSDNEDAVFYSCFSAAVFELCERLFLSWGSVTCVFVVLQMRQVSQAKRWDDLGPSRHTLRQSRVTESLDFPDEEFGVNLGIVSV